MVAVAKLPVLDPSRARGPDFDGALEAHGLQPLVRAEATTLQINVGKLCNMACHHCHVEAGPKRTEIMPRDVAERCVELLDRSPAIEVLDLTGGAPEMNPSFRWLVTEARRRGLRVIDRCNLTILSLLASPWVLGSFAVLFTFLGLLMLDRFPRVDAWLSRPAAWASRAPATARLLKNAFAGLLLCSVKYSYGTEGFVADPDGYVWAIISPP